MPRRIRVNHQVVQRHQSAIIGHCSSFDVRISNVSGATVSVITTATALGSAFGITATQYAEVLRNSANDIQNIADAITRVDAEASAGLRAMV